MGASDGVKPAFFQATDPAQRSLLIFRGPQNAIVMMDTSPAQLYYLSVDLQSIGGIPLNFPNAKALLLHINHFIFPHQADADRIQVWMFRVPELRVRNRYLTHRSMTRRHRQIRPQDFRENLNILPSGMFHRNLQKRRIIFLRDDLHAVRADMFSVSGNQIYRAINAGS